jgi:4a-hydroxytetrahydrobiopterin dehydratase
MIKRSLSFLFIACSLLCQAGANKPFLENTYAKNTHIEKAKPTQIKSERPMNQAEIDRELQKLPDWKIEQQQLQRTFKFQNFVLAIDFVNRLVEPAETAGHHPDLAISYNRVTVSLTTHDVGGLTPKDFALARVISQKFLEMNSP